VAARPLPRVVERPFFRGPGSDPSLSECERAVHARDTIRITGAESFGPRKRLEAAMPSFSQLIVWIVIGLLGGSLAGLIITWDRKGFGLLRNLAVGLAGALVGGFLFRMLGLFPQLENVAISLRDVVSALVGSLIVLGAFWIWRRYAKP
jgi:uncharacterized membrane protein YeaQ/YmgE (transglycosylase-associated protein family)